ncbi:MAG: hypothetical protein U0168_27155 [Nannocystaceae bacterium]
MLVTLTVAAVGLVQRPDAAAAACRIRSVFIAYPVEPGDPPTHRTGKTVHRSFDPAAGLPADCGTHYADGPLDCAPVPLSRAAALARGQSLGDDVAITDPAGEMFVYRFDARGRTTRVTWDPTASGSFDYVFHSRGHCGS